MRLINMGLLLLKEIVPKSLGAAYKRDFMEVIDLN